MTWWQGRLVGFDLETTGPLPEEARIVTAAICEVGGDAPPVTRTWLADPGVEIPEEASEIHGVTTERARAEGRPAAEVIAEVMDALAARPSGAPVVIFNARYDVTVLDRERRRHGLEAPRASHPLRVVDPFVIDKWLDRYRKGSRKLDAICAAYGATLDQAHDADSDALAACRAAWVLGAKGEVVRRVWNADMGREKAALVREWERVRDDLELLHAAQIRWALAERERFAEYKRSTGEVEEAERIAAEVGWPLLEVMAHEEMAA